MVKENKYTRNYLLVFLV